MPPPRLTGRVAPVLPSRDLDGTVQFYARLGFGVVGRYPEEGYLILERDDVELHFFLAPGTDPGCDAQSAYVRLEGDAGNVFRAWAGLGISGAGDAVPRLVAPVDTPYGMREFALVDGDGNLLRIGSELTGPASTDV
ncbi:VOC family protein [Streptomyces sp. HNM0574]|uniref:bleomycin resistance protein n=1 Tax=Streptomyces sp. HNM0574 TaxID=2714954 RepID=UPI00146C52F0|nr:VOC family protein [Streptomyces sp. HNM0574]NLU67201.1 VOC family protein [Streptomyces sp. HNM0574]